MPRVVESKNVIDCMADALPSRYNSLRLPKMRSGFEKLQLHNQCRLHGCAPNECLVVKHQCPVPWMYAPPEEICQEPRTNGTFTCEPKVTIWSNNPLSIGFGIAWIVIGSIFMCASV